MRKHLISHPRFTPQTFEAWLAEKVIAGKAPGCRLREIHEGGKLAGWGGIQCEAGEFEVALVLAPTSWGGGHEIVTTIRRWAREMGHAYLLAHFPESRPQARALKKLFGQPIATHQIDETVFVTYRVEV